jgi:N-acetylmuramoyl-L-alanine amidase
MNFTLPMKQLFGLFILSSLLLLGWVASLESRELGGLQDTQIIRIQTRLLEGGEYVSVSELLPYFADRWQYDAFSGAMLFTRADGAQIGLKIDEERVVMGSRIFHSGTPPNRHEGQIYIPFYLVDTYLFPQVRFTESGNQPEATPLPTTPDNDLSPSGNLFFRYPTTPPSPTPAPTPTQPMYSFTSKETPTQIQTSIFKTVPSAVIILDPGNDPSHPGQSSITGARECDITLAICSRLAENLREYKNYEVLLTRTPSDQEFVSNEHRISFANQNRGSVFISIQCGALQTSEFSRGGVFFMNPKYDKSAQTNQTIITRTAQLIPWHDAYKNYVPQSLQLARAINQELYTWSRSAGIVHMDSNPRPGRFAILRGLTMPGVIIELGNISNPETARYLSSDRIQNDIASELEIEITNFLYDRAGISTRGGE